jgi:hypothetical protein
MNDDLAELNLVAGTNISLSRVGETVVVDCTYDYDPTQIEEEVAALDTKVGDLTNLTTTEKTNLVGAINEINGLIGDIDEALDLINGEVIS